MLVLGSVIFWDTFEILRKSCKCHLGMAQSKMKDWSKNLGKEMTEI